jgi:flagellar biosynthesis chaperone FliJ
MVQFTYRLQRLLEQKEEARKEAERDLARQEHELETQVEALRSLQQRERELVERRELMRRSLLRPGEGVALTASEVMKRSEDVKVVGLQIEDAQKDISSQRVVVEQCEVQVRQAIRRVEEARREVEVLTKHRTKQEERFQRALQAQEELELDEIGNVLHATRRRPT